MTPPTPAGHAGAFDLGDHEPQRRLLPGGHASSSSRRPSRSRWTADPFFGLVSVGPGQTAHATVNVTALDAGATRADSVPVHRRQHREFAVQATAQATFVVAPPPPPTRTGCAAIAERAGRAGRLLRQRQHRLHRRRARAPVSRRRPTVARVVERRAEPLARRLPADGVVERQRRAHRASTRTSGSPDRPSSIPATRHWSTTPIAWAEMAGHGRDPRPALVGPRACSAAAPRRTAASSSCPTRTRSTFWSEVAARYKGDGRVMFELYNEPHDV